MESNCTGPYLIYEVLSNDTYCLFMPNPPQVLVQKYMSHLTITYKNGAVNHSDLCKMCISLHS